MRYTIRLIAVGIVVSLPMIALSACQRAQPTSQPQPTSAPTLAPTATTSIPPETPLPSETPAETSAADDSAALDTPESLPVTQVSDLTLTPAGTQPGFSINPFGPGGLQIVTASASAPAKAVSPTPTHGITVTPPAGSKIVTYSRTAAQISARARFFLDARIAKSTKSASIELRKGLMIYTWQGSLNNQSNVVQRIVLVPRLSPNGLLSLDVGSATQNNAKIDFAKTVLGPDSSFRSAALTTLIVNYEAIAAGKSVKMNYSILLTKCDISPARIVIDQIVPQ